MRGRKSSASRQPSRAARRISSRTGTRSSRPWRPGRNPERPGSPRTEDAVALPARGRERDNLRDKLRRLQGPHGLLVQRPQAHGALPGRDGGHSEPHGDARRRDPRAHDRPARGRGERLRPARTARTGAGTSSGGKIDIAEVEAAIASLSVSRFAKDTSSGATEISFTAVLGMEGSPAVSVRLYRIDGESCLASVNGESVGYVPRMPGCEPYRSRERDSARLRRNKSRLGCPAGSRIISSDSSTMKLFQPSALSQRIPAAGAASPCSRQSRGRGRSPGSACGARRGRSA